MARSNEVGSGHVKITADISDAEQKLDNLKQEVDEATTQVENDAQDMADSVSGSAATAGNAFDKMGDQAKDGTGAASKSFSEATENIQSNVARQVGAITGLIGSVTAAIGVFTIFLNVGKAIGKQLFDTTTQAEKLRKELNKHPDTYRNLQKTATNLEVSGLARLGDTSEDVARKMSGAAVAAGGLGLSLEEAFSRAATIEDKYNTIAERLPQLVTDAEGVTRLVTLSGQEAFEKFADDTEKRIVGLVSNIKRAAAESVEARKRASDQIAESDRAAAKLAEESALKAAETIRSAFENRGVDRGEFAQINDELEQTIKGIESLRDSVGEGGQAQLDKMIESINRVADYRRQKTREEIQERKRLEAQAERDAIASEVESLRRETLDPIQREIEDTQQRIEAAKQEAADSTNKAIADANQRLIDALGGKLDRLQKEQATQMKELPAAIERAVENGMDRVLSKTGLLNVQQTLYAIQQNADLIAGEVTR